MTTWENIGNACRDRMKDFVEDPQSVEVQYDNEPFDGPDESALWNDAVWIRFRVIPGDSRQVQAGLKGTFRTPGVCIAMIFCKENKGDKLALEMADIIKTAFRAVSYQGVNFQVPFVGSGRLEQKWWLLNVTIPFISDEVA